MTTSVDEAKKRHAQLLVDLKKVSKPMPANRVPPLDPLPCNTQVAIWEAKRGEIERLRQSHKANGIVMRNADGYHIFIDAGGDPSSTQAMGRQASDYFLIYHEYAHIIHGDVFEDDHVRIMKRSPACIGDQEALANGFAAEKTIPHVTGAQLQALEATYVAEGWIGPSNPLYTQLAGDRTV